MRRLVVIFYLALSWGFFAVTRAQDAKTIEPPKVEVVLQDALNGNVKAQMTIGLMYGIGLGLHPTRWHGS